MKNAARKSGGGASPILFPPSAQGVSWRRAFHAELHSLLPPSEKNAPPWILQRMVHMHQQIIGYVVSKIEKKNRISVEI